LLSVIAQLPISFYGELRWQDANLDTSTANGQKYVYWDSNSRL